MHGQSSAGIRPEIPEPILATRLIAIARRLEPALLLDVTNALVAGGVRALELTLDGDGALDGIEELTHRFAPQDLLVGAGTVMSVASAERALQAGARFLVMPHTDVELVRFAASRGIPAFPGAFTPTEAYAGWQAGAAGIKVFPASAVGPTFFREMRGPFREIPLVPTGGVTIENAVAFVAAGAVAVAMGSWLTGGGDATVARERAMAVVAALREAAA